MKKFVALLLALAMVFALCACGNSNSAAPKQDDAAESSQPSDNASDNASENQSAADLSALKVGFIFLHDENSTYDLNFMNAAKEACETLGVESVFKTNIPEDQSCYEAAAELADAGCNIVFADSFGHEPYMIDAAKEPLHNAPPPPHIFPESTPFAPTLHNPIFLSTQDVPSP